ncbi:hypothetical protein LTR36_004393 [Oleoguttula mirabilis]|uniref:Uncharacterized protein n=1 Tax=Oleoguttula mirabilis TaxID=1507867 RepID=A0AAV9JG01_9PEZI|nr:hypothetical protein LTR36_004393 [Oleoguttula mirabilis]
MPPGVTMQSSPPTRAWDRPPSPAGSEYSLDLGALGLDHSNASSPVPKRKVDRVLSEDIDGPSDFTEHLERWMHGGTMGKGTMRSARGALQSLKEQDVNARNSVPVQRLEPPHSPANTEGEHTASHHTPSNSPPKEPAWGSEPHNHREEHVSSDWDPYEEGSTPQPPAHKQFLQPTVEDYYSELTSARKPLPEVQDSPEQVQSPMEARVSPSRTSKSPTPGRASSPTLSPVRSPVMQRAALVQLSSPFTEPRGQDEIDRQLQQLQARCQQLEHLNSALKQALDEEQRIRRQEKVAHEAQLTHASRREKDLTEMKEEAYNHLTDFRSEYAEQKERLRTIQAQAASQQQETERVDQQHKEEVEKLKDKVESQREAHQRELQAMRQELELERRSRDDAEETARVHREEMDEDRDAHEVEVQRLKLELQQADDARGTIVELEARLKSARQETADVSTAKAAAEDATATVKAELAASKQSRDGDATRMTNDHRRAVELAEGLQKKLKELQQQLRDEQSAHDAEIERLQESNEEGQTATAEEISTLRNEAEANQSVLNDAIFERDAAQDSLATLQAGNQDLQHQMDSLQPQLEALKAERADSETVNAALDARISDAMRKREAYWRGKLEESEKERRVMAKALLHQWGREEVGEEVPQGYEYKYVSRSPRSPTKAQNVL